MSRPGLALGQVSHKSAGNGANQMNAVTATSLTSASTAKIRSQPGDIASLVTLYVFVLMAIPSRYTFAPFGGAGAPSTLLSAIFLIVYLLRWVHPASPIGGVRQPLRAAALGIFCAFLASYAVANLHKIGTTEQNGADRGMVMICGWVGILLLTADGVSSLERLDVLLRRIVFGASAMAALGIVQFFTGLNIAMYIVIPGLTANAPYDDISVRGSYNRPSATAIHPLEFAFVLAVVLPVAIHRARFAPRNQKFKRWLQVFLISVALPMTVSRSAILGLVVVMAVILPVWPRQDRWRALGVVAIGALGFQVLVPGFVRDMSSLFFAIGSDASTTSRTSALSNALPLIAQHPLFGSGFGTFMSSIFFYTDNQYLNAGIELGLVGVAAIVGLFITGWWSARDVRRHSTDPAIRHLSQCLAASCAVMLFVYGTFDTLYFPMAAGITFLMLGCIAALWRLTRGSSSGRRDSIGAEHAPRRHPPGSGQLR
jgi:polysaccharide biosynthesis protein PslJ